MKRIILSLVFGLVAANAFAGSNRLAHLQLDQASYTVGSKAVIFAHLDRIPENDQTEFFLKVRVGGLEIPAILLSDRMAIAFPPKFSEPGAVDVDLDVYLQNSAVQREMDEAIAVYSLEVADLEKKKAGEIDPEARDLLQLRIDEVNSRIQNLNLVKDENRSLREINHLEASVLTGGKQSPAASNFFTTRLNRPSGEYIVSERATFYAHLLTDFTGPDGPRENVFRGDLDGLPLQTRFAGDEYFFESPQFTPSAVGAHTFHAKLYIRSKKQADLLRSAKVQATRRKADLQKQKDSSHSASKQAYYQLKITELTAALTAIDAQLESILLLVGSDSAAINVTNSMRAEGK